MITVVTNVVERFGCLKIRKAGMANKIAASPRIDIWFSSPDIFENTRRKIKSNQFLQILQAESVQ